MGRIVFKISVGFVASALILLAISLYLSNYYLQEQLRLAETGDLRGARDDVKWAARLDPFSPDPPASEAYLELRQGQTEAAAEAFREAIRREPVNYKNYASLGDLQRQQLSDPKAAAQSYQEALKYNPHATVVVSRLAEALLSAGDLEGAKAQYEWLRDHEKIPLTDLYTLGKIQIRLGEPEEAIKIFEDARNKANAGTESSDESSNESEAQKRAFMESLDLGTADALVAQGHYDEAREVLSQSSSQQASTVLALLDENPEAYRESVLNASIG